MLQEVQGKAGELRTTRYLDKVRNDLGLPEAAQEWLQDLYAAYEGEDLEAEFPNLAQKRVDGLRKAFQESAKAQEDAVKSKQIPGKNAAHLQKTQSSTQPFSFVLFPL